MGAPASTASERTDTPITDLRLTGLRAQNTGVCMEPRHPGVSLHLGAGDCTWPSWINVDGIEGSEVVSDLRRLPFADGYADRIAAIHVVEHFYAWDAKPLLKEWLRVLKPGGQLIVELPCMDKVLNYISRCITEGVPLNPSFSWWAMWGNPEKLSVPMTHKWGYGYDSIQMLVERAGYTNITFERPRYHFAERDMRLCAIKGQ